jgi:glycosyltransferase involved in cell wall biosynthesis
VNVLALLATNKAAPGAVEIYRITMPLEYLNNKTRDIQCGWMTLSVAEEAMRNWRLAEVLDYDIIVLHRWLTNVPEAGQVVEALKAHGAKIVYEADDDYSGLYRDDLFDIPGQSWKSYIGRVDAFTVTTKPLAERLDTNRPVHVLPNAIDRTAFGAISQATARLFPDRLVIMLAGTKTHVEDWKVVAEVAPKIAAKYPQVKFVAATEPWAYDYLPGAGFEFLPSVGYAKYPCVLAQADILCAPLVPDDPFNACKSPIKAIEGWCAARKVGKTKVGGCAVVASKCEAYKRTVQHRHNGLLVEHTPQAWEDALCELVEDSLLRQKIAVGGWKSSTQYDIEANWQQWASAYGEIVGR